MNKRGISEVIISLVLVLVAFAAIAVFWVVASSIIQSTSEKINLEKQTINLQVESANLQGNGDLLIKVKRNPGPGSVAGITFVISGTGGNKIIEKMISIGELEEKTYTISKNEIAGLETVQNVAVAPIITASTNAPVQKNIVSSENRKIIIID